MDAETFLDHFATVAEAPGGLQRLRNLVLDLAFTGRLTRQDPSDEPAGALLDQISATHGGIDRHDSVEYEREGTRPASALPGSWQWAPFSRVARIASNLVSPTGYMDSVHVAPDNIEKLTGRLLPCRTIRQDGVTSNKHRFFAGQILYSKIRPNLSKAVIVDFDGLCSADMYPIESWVYTRFLHHQILSPAFVRAVTRDDNRLAMPKVNQQQLNSTWIAVAPLNEQKRIAAKVDELMALCDDLGARQKRRRHANARFRGSALHALVEAQTSDDLRRAWERLSINWSSLTDHPDSTNDLRETIHQLAVEGRLTSQDSRDEPASVILEACQNRKRSLVQEGAIRSRSSLPDISPEEAPYPLPSGWALARLEQWCDIAGGVAKGRKLAGREVVTLPYLRVANVKAGYLLLDEIKMIEVPLDEVDRYSLRSGDVLLTEGGDWDKLGRSAIWNGEIEPCLHQNHVFRARPLSEGLMPEWVSLFTNSESGRKYFQSKAKRTTNLASINMTELRSTPLPVPPLEEQRRILRRLTEIEALLSRLNAALVATRAGSAHVATALAAAV